MSIDVSASGAEPLDVAVVGGGQAGLAVAWHLAQAGLDFAVLDAGPEPGHAWRRRWDSLVLFTPSQYDGLPGMAFPAPSGHHPSKDEVADYLRAYAARFDLPIRFRTTVTRLTRRDDVFVLQTTRGEVRARQVVVATGAFQVPFVPDLAAGLSRGVVQVHSDDYGRPTDLPPGPVLVVGAGNSGLQIACELGVSRPVHVAVGTMPRMVPQRLLGRDLFWWLTRTRFLTTPADSRTGRRLRSRGELVIGTTRRDLDAAGVRLHSRATSAAGRTVTFADRSALDVNGVVWATGYRPDHSWIDVPGVVADGRIAHRRGITEVSGLSFIGLPWQHTRGSALLGFVADDAAHVGRHVVATAGTHRNATLPA